MIIYLCSFDSGQHKSQAHQFYHHLEVIPYLQFLIFLAHCSQEDHTGHASECQTPSALANPSELGPILEATQLCAEQTRTCHPQPTEGASRVHLVSASWTLLNPQTINNLTCSHPKLSHALLHHW